MDQPDAFASAPGPTGSGPSGLARTGAGALRVLERVVPIAARIVGALNVYSWIVIGATATIVVIVGGVTRPRTLVSIITFVLLVAVLAIPGTALRFFRGAMLEVLRLPDLLRSSPDLVRNHGGELAMLVGQAATRKRDRFTALPRDMWSAGRILMRAHGDLPEYGQLIRLINVPFLFVSMVSFLVGFMLIGLALLMLLTLPFVVALQ